MDRMGVGVAERVIAGLTVRIDETLCVGFGDCVGVAPDVFVLNAEGIVEFREVATADPERLIDAARVCPVEALAVLAEEGDHRAM
jgi:ferredoxin